MGRALRRIARTVVHNWPLKTAAVLLATLLYAGLLSQDSNTYAGPVTVTPVNKPAGTVITNQVRDVEQIRYLAPAEVGRLQADDFRATVDLVNAKVDGQSASYRVVVTPLDPRVTIIEIRPRSVQVTLDVVAQRTMPVTIETDTLPAGLEMGDIVATPTEITLTGPSGAVNEVAMIRIVVPIDASGIDIDREFRPRAVNAADELVSGVEIDPPAIHVSIPVYTDRETRTVPVNPVITGTPGAGFRVAAVAVEPLTVSIEGDGEELADLGSADTAPIQISGATRDVVAEVALALPPGVTSATGTVRVAVTIQPVTETRSFVAGLRLFGQRAGFTYQTAPLTVILTLFGSTADLDRIGSAPVVVGVNVAGLEPGTHELAVVPSLPSGVTVAAISPESITITLAEVPSPAPAPASGSPGSADPSASPSVVP